MIDLLAAFDFRLVSDGQCRRTHRQTTRTDCRSPSVAVATCFTSTAFSDGSRRGPCVLFVTRCRDLNQESWRKVLRAPLDWVVASRKFHVKTPTESPFLRARAPRSASMARFPLQTISALPQSETRTTQTLLNKLLVDPPGAYVY